MFRWSRFKWSWRAAHVPASVVADQQACMWLPTWADSLRHCRWANGRFSPPISLWFSPHRNEGLAAAGGDWFGLERPRARAPQARPLCLAAGSWGAAASGDGTERWGYCGVRGLRQNDGGATAMQRRSARPRNQGRTPFNCCYFFCVFM